jgi:hypothetical protein
LHWRLSAGMFVQSRALKLNHETLHPSLSERQDYSRGDWGHHRIHISNSIRRLCGLAGIHRQIVSVKFSLDRTQRPIRVRVVLLSPPMRRLTITIDTSGHIEIQVEANSAGETRRLQGVFSAAFAKNGLKPLQHLDPSEACVPTQAGVTST